jgi:hypothetical protein
VSASANLRELCASSALSAFKSFIAEDAERGCAEIAENGGERTIPALLLERSDAAKLIVAAGNLLIGCIETGAVVCKTLISRPFEGICPVQGIPSKRMIIKEINPEVKSIQNAGSGPGNARNLRPD